MKQRILYLDLLRIIATIAVITIHVCSLDFFIASPRTFLWQVDNVFNSMSRFAVPIFFMISGVLFLDKKKVITVEKILKHNILKVFIAFLFWAIVYGIISFLPQIANGDFFTLSVFKDFLIETFLGRLHLWFIYAIIGLYLITPLLKKICEDKKNIEYFLKLSFIFCFGFNALKCIPGFDIIIDNLTEQFNINFVLGYTSYYLLGHYIYEYDINKSLKKWIYFLGIFNIVFTIIMTSYCSIAINNETEIFYNNLMPTTLFTSMALFIFFKDKISNIKFKDKSISLIKNISSKTFGIYLVHMIVLLACNKIGINPSSFNPIIMIPVMTIIVFIGSYITTYIISKIPILNKHII